MMPATINCGWQEAADNARPGSGASLLWFMVAPYGRNPSRSGVQVFDAGAAERMKAAFENAKAKAGSYWRGVPIYVGFPNVDSQMHKDGRKYGAVVTLQAREDGLYALGKWSGAGRELLANEHFSYANPLWDIEPIPGQPGAVRPVALVSVGLTNAAIPGALPLGVIGGNEAEESTLPVVRAANEREARRLRLEAAVSAKLTERPDLDRNAAFLLVCRTRPELLRAMQDPTRGH